MTTWADLFRPGDAENFFDPPPREHPFNPQSDGFDAVTAWWLSAGQFAEIIRDHPDIATAVSRVITGRLRAADLRRRQFADSTTGARIADLLADLADRYGVSTSDGVVVSLRISQQDIAAMVAASREAAARTLRVLREAGIISTARRRFTIHRPDDLRSFSG